MNIRRKEIKMTLMQYCDIAIRMHHKALYIVVSLRFQLRHNDYGEVLHSPTQNYSHLEEPNVDWTYAVYGNVKEDIPANIPKPLGKTIVLTCYINVNLLHDLVTGRSAMGILHLLNLTPIDFMAKHQDTVETATYGSEFIAARITVEQIIDLRNTSCTS